MNTRNQSDSPKKQIRETVFRHTKAPEILTTAQISALALELSRNADGTINRDTFKEDCNTAFGILIELKKKIEQNANLSPE